MLAAEATSEVVLASEVRWEPLNPARGDKSPQATTLWGDRQGAVATGFLVKFIDGFASPPHIHNVSYRGIVISGHIHNDDPDAADMWMPAGSFWTQPKGEVHITAASGSTNVAYIEIEQGPYLVRPTEDAFDSGERPINVDASNIVWLDLPSVTDTSNGPRQAFLWGSPNEGELNGTLIRLPAGYVAELLNPGATFGAVVIKGRPQHRTSGTSDVKMLEPGSYFSSKGEVVHRIASSADAESLIYIRTDGRYEVIPAQ